MYLTYEDVPVNDDGEAVEYHVAARLVAVGEITRCERLIDYTLWKGTAEGAPICPDCEARSV